MHFPKYFAVPMPRGNRKPIKTLSNFSYPSFIQNLKREKIKIKSGTCSIKRFKLGAKEPQQYWS